MTEELVATAEAAASAGSLSPLAQVITEWKHTAQIHADRDLHHALRVPTSPTTDRPSGLGR
jgi:hypothetical protein